VELENENEKRKRRKTERWREGAWRTKGRELGEQNA